MEVNSLKKMKNKDVLLTLPGTLKIRDIGWLSIWCKRFTVNYGEVYIPDDLEIPEKVVSCMYVCNRSSAFLRLDEPRTGRLGQSPPETVSYTTMNSGCLPKSLHLISERDISGLTIHSFCRE